MSILAKYGKSIAAVVAAALIALSSAFTDGHVDAAEGVTIAIATVTAIAVWLAPNLPQSPGIKTALAMVLSGLNAAAMLLVDGWSTADTINVVIAALGVLGVLGAPAQSAGDNLVPRAVAAAASRQAYGGS